MTPFELRELKRKETLEIFCALISGPHVRFTPSTDEQKEKFKEDFFGYVLEEYEKVLESLE
jgi:hypothetical protein